MPFLGKGTANPYPGRVEIESPDPRKITTCFTTHVSLVTLSPASKMSFPSSKGSLFPVIRGQPVVLQRACLIGKEAESQRVNVASWL